MLLPCLVAAFTAGAILLSFWADAPAFAQAAQDATRSATDSTTADTDDTPQGQIDAKVLIGDAVDNADSPQYNKVTSAIDKFSQRRVKEARDLRTQLRTAHPTLPPAELFTDSFR